MATCRTCGAENVRVRMRWNEAVNLPDECTQCASGSFEAVKSVRDGQITMGHEYMPTMYRKTDAGYVPTDELLADTEDQILNSMNQPLPKEAEEVIERKRATRRTKPMSQAELDQTLARLNA